MAGLVGSKITDSSLQLLHAKRLTANWCGTVTSARPRGSFDRLSEQSQVDRQLKCGSAAPATAWRGAPPRNPIRLTGHHTSPGADIRQGTRGRKLGASPEMPAKAPFTGGATGGPRRYLTRRSGKKVAKHRTNMEISEILAFPAVASDS